MTPTNPAQQPLLEPSNSKNIRLLLGGMGILTGIGFASAAYAFLHEPFNIELEQLTMRLPNAGGRLPAEGLRILHLSDTHFQGHHRRERTKIERVAELVADIEYDLLVHTGDFLHFDHGLGNVLDLLDALPQPLLGKYAVLGNHDYTHYAMGEALPRMWHTYWDEIQDNKGHDIVAPLKFPWRLFQFVRYVRDTPLDGRRTGKNDANRLITALEERGYSVLHNEAIHLKDEQRSLDLYLAGVDDVVEGRPRLHHALDVVPHEAPTILLSHNPDILGSPRIGQVDLVLSGHTHGGQIVLPFWGPAHTQSEHLTRERVSGYFQQKKTHVYISRGLGEGIPLRFGARPQLALITVMGEEN